MSTPAATTPTPAGPPPYNRIGLDYSKIPPRRLAIKVIDAHTHCNNVERTHEFLKTADAWGIDQIWSQTPLEDVDAFVENFPGRFHFVAVPKWQDVKDGITEPFVTDWLKRLDTFYEKGARLFKLHLAPGTKNRWQIHLAHPLIRRVITHAYARGYSFMTHVGDPKAWFAPGKAYADETKFETFERQFPLLDEMLAEFPNRIHLGAHMGGSLEDLPALQRRLDRFPNYVIDSSATKWIVRAAAAHSQTPEGHETLRQFIIHNADRILFGSDLVVGDKFNADHYASRYWAHQMLWESNYNGESPIDDPDAPSGVPLLVGLNLPDDVLLKLYRTNALRWLPRA